LNEPSGEGASFASLILVRGDDFKFPECFPRRMREEDIGTGEWLTRLRRDDTGQGRLLTFWGEEAVPREIGES